MYIKRANNIPLLFGLNNTKYHKHFILYLLYLLIKEFSQILSGTCHKVNHLVNAQKYFQYFDFL